MKFKTTRKLLKLISEANDISLSVKDLHVSYGKIRALKGISMDVYSGEVVSIIGANGAGKSTLLKTVSGLVKPGSGEIFFCRHPISGMPPEKITRLGLVSCTGRPADPHDIDSGREPGPGDAEQQKSRKDGKKP